MHNIGPKSDWKVLLTSAETRREYHLNSSSLIKIPPFPFISTPHRNFAPVSRESMIEDCYILHLPAATEAKIKLEKFDDVHIITPLHENKATKPRDSALRGNQKPPFQYQITWSNPILFFLFNFGNHDCHWFLYFYLLFWWKRQYQTFLVKQR